eukprot:CAMPEP_0206439666 /NCGR_PEP_ID=MMETSP0324_2-20121206/12339_1 /ASSEMBLY_ACC=CAM_ASM_000836 /TAXON_ID=2866 /ORGANISM="Crypthecodinium cohnii, Strain Seligo" /LENGTH=251 /DNA_ID=CAMNT_0053907315 /DNA_START=31 /DNA_END=783 /DNA_ORIENTATION=+
MATEELPQVGSEPVNDYLLRALVDLGCEDVPAGGFTGKMGKQSTVKDLKKAICNRLRIDEDGLTISCEGDQLDPSMTMSENGVFEPGPAARAAGAKLELTFMLARGVELGAIVARREQAEAERQAIERAEEERKMEERKLVAQAENRAAQEKADKEEEEKQRAQAEAREQEERADRITVHCFLMSQDTQRAATVETRRSSTAGEFAQELARAVGIIDQHAQLSLLHDNQEMDRRQTLQRLGVQDGAHIYYW